MARKKTDEELMIEAELSAAGDAGAPAADVDAAGRGDAGARHEDAVLPDVDAPRRARRRRRPSPKVAAVAVAGVAVVAVVAVVVARVMFANSTDVWDGTADTSWYSEGMTSMEITTAEQLAGMRKLCNEENVTFAGVRFRLARNLDLYGIPTKPIGDGRQEQGGRHQFWGSFDGGGHTISGIDIEEDMWDFAGLFGSVDDGDLSNLTVEGKVTGQVRVGGIVGEMSGGSISNCTNRCKVSSVKTATSYYPVTADVGGVCGIWLGIMGDDKDEARIENLVNEGEVSARACSAGGVIGTIANCEGVTVRVNDLRNDGKVTVYCASDDRDEAVGGVVGVVGALGTDLVGGLVNNGEVSCSTVLSVGGVFGALLPPQREEKADGSGAYTAGVQLGRCENTARIAANADDERAHVGGIVGYLDDPDVAFDDCENAGELAATNGKSDDIASIDGAEVWDAWEDEHPATWA